MKRIRIAIKDYFRRRKILKVIRVLDGLRDADATYPMISVYSR